MSYRVTLDFLEQKERRAKKARKAALEYLDVG